MLKGIIKTYSNLNNNLSNLCRYFNLNYLKLNHIKIKKLIDKYLKCIKKCISNSGYIIK